MTTVEGFGAHTSSDDSSEMDVSQRFSHVHSRQTSSAHPARAPSMSIARIHVARFYVLVWSTR